ncbi:hypothetical protein CPB84DRAFT_888453 [Gymnopilus junonius]|uniref:Secreted protein n=1 Tax=Gymnopilus junonius TaxID=109634 RepID=A0A9P5TP15_GYMJU|nr:hypothetical protein CPB84DRAFT_888453 [Gymnopilus junonius]
MFAILRFLPFLLFWHVYRPVKEGQSLSRPLLPSLPTRTQLSGLACLRPSVKSSIIFVMTQMATRRTNTPLPGSKRGPTSVGWSANCLSATVRRSVADRILLCRPEAVFDLRFQFSRCNFNARRTSMGRIARNLR